jgi:hypothetical protein
MKTTVGNRGPTRLEERLAWAREVLQVEEDAAPAEVRGKFLRDLAEQRFVPAESVSRAFQTLRFDADGIAELEDPHEFLLAEEQQLQEEVDEFARQMFRWPIDQRKRLWIQLQQRCEHALRPQARLHALAIGLKADPAAVDINAPLVKELAGYACQLFPLRPVARAKLRNEILSRIERSTHPDSFDNSADPQSRYKSVADHWTKARANWENAARVLQSRHPELAALDTQFVERLANWTAEQKRMTKPQPAPSRRQPTVRTTQSSGRSYWWVVALVVMFMANAMRFMGNSSDSSRYPQQPYKYKTYDQIPNLQVEVEQMLRSQREQSSARTDPFADPAPQDSSTPFAPGGATAGSGYEDPAKRRQQYIENLLRQAEEAQSQNQRNAGSPVQPPRNQPPNVNSQRAAQPSYRSPSPTPPSNSLRSPNAPSYGPPAGPSPGAPPSPFR